MGEGKVWEEVSLNPAVLYIPIRWGQVPPKESGKGVLKSAVPQEPRKKVCSGERISNNNFGVL